MRPATVVAACVSLALLSGCEGSPKPSPPPASQDALTTTTATPTPLGDEVEATTEAAPTTEAAATTETPTDAGPPEMPAEAREQTEAGAEAFVLHYMDLVNYTGIHPTTGLLEPLAEDSCGTCGQFAATVVDLHSNEHKNDGDIGQVIDSLAMRTEQTAVVNVTANQRETRVLDATGNIIQTYPEENGLQMEFNLTWHNDGWKIDAIFLLEQS